MFYYVYLTEPIYQELYTAPAVPSFHYFNGESPTVQEIHKENLTPTYYIPSYKPPEQPPASTIDPLVLLPPLPPPPPSSPPQTEFKHSFTPIVDYVPDSTLFMKRKTIMRERLRECSSDSRLNMLPSVPQYLVDSFWSIYRMLHDPTRKSPPGRQLFKSFYEINGKMRTCLLCNHSIKNTTQMTQHIAGTHFAFFEHRCTRRDCSFSSARPADLRKHVKEQHDNARLRYKCKLCSETVKHKKNLIRHSRIHD